MPASAISSTPLVRIAQGARILLFSAFLLMTLHPSVSSGMALAGGILFALLLGNPLLIRTRKWTPHLLRASVIGLGASMNLMTVAVVGMNGIAYTAFGILFTFIAGWGIQRCLGTERPVSVLLAAGTAICGGSAIAAISPVIGARDHEVSISLATVFILNAAALFIFPWVGHHFDLSQSQFGLWSALAIHDVSSVVGASMQYGPEALTIATSTKLARALWIIPMGFVIGAVWNRRSLAGASVKGKKPWFILGFLLVAALVTWIPALREPGEIVAAVARRCLVLTLFLIGSGLSLATLRQTGVRPFAHGLALWILVGTGSFLAIWLQWMS